MAKKQVSLVRQGVGFFPDEYAFMKARANKMRVPISQVIREVVGLGVATLKRRAAK